MLKRFALFLTLLCLPAAAYAANTMVCSPWMGRDDHGPSYPVCAEYGCRVVFSGTAGSGTSLIPYGNLYLGTGFQPRHCAFCNQEVRNALNLPSSYTGACQNTPNGDTCATHVCGVLTDWCSWSYYNTCPSQGGGGGVCETPGSNIHINQGEDPGGDGAVAEAATAEVAPVLVELTFGAQRLRMMAYATKYQLFQVPQVGRPVFSADDAGVYFVTPPGVRELPFQRFMDRAADLLVALTDQRAHRVYRGRSSPFTDLSNLGPREVLLLTSGSFAVTKRSVPPLGVQQGEALIPQMHIGGYPRLVRLDAAGVYQPVTMAGLLRLVYASGGRVTVTVLH